MPETYLGEVKNGVVVFDAGGPAPADGTRVRVEPASAPVPASDGTDPLARTRAFLLAAAREAEAHADECPLPADLAENHDHYAHGRPLP